MADVAVAAAGRAGRHHVERRRRLRPGERAVVQADDADDLRRKDAARGQARDRHAVGKLRGPVHGLAGVCTQHVARERKRDRRRAGLRLALEFADEVAHRVGFVRDRTMGPELSAALRTSKGRRARRTVEEEAVDFAAERARPCLRAARAGQPGAQPEDVVAIRQKPPQRFIVRGAAAESRCIRRTGHQPVDDRIRVRHGITEQEAAYPLPPRVVGRGRQSFRLPLGFVRTPPDAGVAHPGAQSGEVGFVQPEPGADRGRVERGEDGFGAEPRIRQIEQVEKGAQTARAGRPRTRAAERHAVRGAEDRVDGRAVHLRVWREHQDVRGLQVGMGVEQPEQTVVQHLGLAHRRMADVDLDGIVGRVLSVSKGRRVGFRAFARQTEVENVALDRGQPMGALGRLEMLLRIRDVDEGVERVAAGLSPRREQLVPLREISFLRVGARGPAVDLVPRKDVAPVLPARIEHEQVDVDLPVDGGEQVEIGGRERGHREKARAPRPVRRPVGPWIDSACGFERVDGRHPMAGRPFVADQALPQLRLPVRRRAALPLSNPVRAVDQTPVEDAGETVGEFESLTGVSVRQIAVHGRRLAFRHECGQHVVEAPAQPGRGERLVSGQGGDRAAHDRPGERGRLLEADVGRHAEIARECERKPSSQRGMRHDDPLGRERLARVGAHETREFRGERLDPIRGIQPHRELLLCGRQRRTGAPAGRLRTEQEMRRRRRAGHVFGDQGVRAALPAGRSTSGMPPDRVARSGQQKGEQGE